MSRRDACQLLHWTTPVLIDDELCCPECHSPAVKNSEFTNWPNYCHKELVAVEPLEEIK